MSYCGVKWGSENTQRSTTYSNYSKGNTLVENANSSSSGDKTDVNNIKKRIDTSRASKSQTEIWILSKLSTYTPNGQYKSFAFVSSDPMLVNGSTKDNIKYYFDKYNLIIEYNETFSNSYNSKTEKKVITIPVYDI